MPYVVKWNRHSDNKNEMLNEIKFQTILSKNPALAPKIYEVYEDDLHVYVIMEDLNNEGYVSLDKIINGIDKWSWQREKSTIVDLVSEALTKLHSKRIAHKDLHMKNIFINPNKNNVKFIDFGRSEEYDTVQKAEKADFDTL